MGTSEFIDPTRNGRFKLAGIYAVAILFVISVELFWPRLMNYINSLPLCQQLPWFQALVIIGYLSFVIAAFAWIHLSHRILSSGQAPPPGALAFFRVKIKRGWRARLQGYIVLLAAIFLLLFPTYILARFWPDISPVFISVNGCNGVNT